MFLERERKKERKNNVGVKKTEIKICCFVLFRSGGLKLKDMIAQLYRVVVEKTILRDKKWGIFVIASRAQACHII